jgi:hypothetical protein
MTTTFVFWSLLIGWQAPELDRSDHSVELPSIVSYPGRSTSLLPQESVASRLARHQLTAHSQMELRQNITRELESVQRLRAARVSIEQQRDLAAIDLVKSSGQVQSQQTQIATHEMGRIHEGQQQATAHRAAAAQHGFSITGAADARIGEAFAAGFTNALTETVTQVGETQREAIRTGGSLAGMAMGMPTGAMPSGGGSSPSGSKSDSGHKSRKGSQGGPSTSSSANVGTPMSQTKDRGSPRMPASNSHPQGTNNLVSLDGPRPKSTATPPDCSPRLEPKRSIDSVVLSAFGYGDDSCCGASRNCDHVGSQCFAIGSQEEACRQHDGDLAGLSAWDANNPDVYRAHQEASRNSPSLPVRSGLRIMRERSLAEPTRKAWQRSGLPIVTAPDLPPQG